MTKNLKLALSALALLALAASGVAAKKHMDYVHAGQPYLKGHCFVDPKQGVGLAIVDSATLKDQKGNDVEAYLTEMVLGPISLNGPALEVREANKELADAVKAGKLEEVNCENGEPISK